MDSDADLAEPHRVRRVRWLGQAASSADGLALRCLLAQQQADVHAALGEVLARFDTPGKVRHIGRLDLRVTAPTLRTLADNLPQLVARAVREALPLTDGAGGPAAGASTAVNESSSADFRQRAFAHYLLTGQLPWALGGLPHAAALQSLESAAMHAADAWLAGDPTPVLPASAAMRSLPARVAALARWLALLPATALARLDSATDDWAVARGAAAADTIEACKAAGAAAPVLAQELRAVRLAMRIDIERGGGVPIQPLGRWADERRAALDAPARGALARLAATITLGSQGAQSALPTPARQPMPTGEPDPMPPLRPTVDAGPGREAADQGRLVPLAGLVLMHPYLPRLLAALRLHDGRTGGPLSAAALHQALPLLHWAATGRDEVHEFELPLVKLLLGLPPDAPLAAPLATAAGPASAAARLETTGLLDALIGHWPALRNTHIDGLRVSFLQRPGLLQRGGGHWQLRMESASFDMLLSTLPWGIHFVKLPWMDEALVVDWPTP